ncbi:LPS export ABC transporter periplasmic protein LptC [Candidatus Atribacteria bacterium RBG_19FT_COMBO_35_14]|uniref:LPS export ABC transporter periplasmic protein LptC n=1 Tax=Candidatus Sediminicultor quintus TaxID=1797291 RepID=A0A1F5A9Z9_9BACT|nr:MAG: LPS export ABC transporter periplasmic protein LptC [Candidatus Atribacteria bacterium RBG_19FT_COMBO_35_14]
MLKRKYLWFILIIILVIVLSLYFIYNGKNKSSVQKEEEIEETEEDIVVQEAPVKIERGTVVGMKAGKKEWEIEADKISLAEDRKKTIFEKIKRAVIFKDNEPYLNIRLNKCIADMGSKSMELVGEVVIETKEGDILKGERFYWDSEEETLASLEPVELIVKENNIIADWLVSDVELNKLELQGNVKVTFIIE